MDSSWLAVEAARLTTRSFRVSRALPERRTGRVAPRAG